MSSTVDLVEKKRILLESIDTANSPDKTIDEIRKNEMGADLHKLKLIRNADLKNPIIGYLNLNSLRKKYMRWRNYLGIYRSSIWYSQKQKLMKSFPIYSFY